MEAGQISYTQIWNLGVCTQALDNKNRRAPFVCKSPLNFCLFGVQKISARDRVRPPLFVP